MRLPLITRREFAAGSLGAATLVQAAPATALVPAVHARRAEVETFRRFAETTHPRGREAASTAEWRRRWGALAASADRMTDGVYMVALQRAIGWFGDGHSALLPVDYSGIPEPMAGGALGLSLPIKVRLFDDGAFVVAAQDEAAPLLGARIDRIGARSVIDLMREGAREWPGNPAWAQRWGAGHFAQPALLQGLGAVADAGQPIVVVGSHRGRSMSATLRPGRDRSQNLTVLHRTESEREGWRKAAGTNNYVRAMPDRGVLFVQLDDMDDVDGLTFAKLTDELFAAIDRAAVSDRLVIDLRRNGGGNNFLGEALRKRIARSPFNRPGGCYVLTGPVTFSAAQNLANRIERETFATFVGGPTGGSPNHYGDAKPMVGAATGLTMIVSSLPWFDSYPQDRRRWIMPDIAVADRFADWSAGLDPALDAALTDRQTAIANERDQHRVFYFGRPSQVIEWQSFWR